MKILKLEWRNIFSYGNKLETIEFGDDGKLWQLSGKSGSGKSSLLSLPKLLFYGQCEDCYGEKIKLESIPNRANGNGWLRGTVKVDSDIYVIERKFKPTSISVMKNDAVIDKAGVKDLQGFIEEEILKGMPYHIFSNVVTLSLNSFKSFISMTPANKRDIIDRIFSMEILNKVSELIKKDIKDVGASINNSNSQIFSFNQTLKTAEDELAKVRESENKEEREERLKSLKDKIDELEKSIASIDESLLKHNEDYSAQQNYYNNLCAAETQLTGEYSRVNTELASVRNQINVFNNDKCPVCGTSFNSDTFVHVKEALNTQSEKLTDELTELSRKLTRLNELKTTTTRVVNDIRKVVGDLTSQRSSLVTTKNEIYLEMEGINLASEKSESASIERIIEDTKKSIGTVTDNLKKDNSVMNLLEILSALYTKDAIKQRLMDNYIPVLNDEIRETLEFLHFPYTLEFDNKFDAHLYSFGKEIETRTLSMGEHKKVDLAVLCSILKMIKRKYPQINLVCLDETLSSLDYESSADILQYLKHITENMALNIFIVSHTFLDENVFDQKLLAVKENGFTDLKWL